MPEIEYGTELLGGGSALPVFSVSSYAGADPSGATDSSAAVYAAQAAAVTAGGGYVNFGTGTWKFQPVTVEGVTIGYEYIQPPLVHFQFAGPGVTILTPLNANAPLFQVASGTYAAGVRMTGGFTVKAHASGSTGPAIDLTNARQWVIDSPSYLDSSEGTLPSPGTYNSVIGFGINTYACRITDPVCEGQTLGTCFIGAENPATVVANNNTIVNPLFEGNTASYMIDAAGTGELNMRDGIIEGNTVTSAIRLGNQTRVRGMHFESNAAYSMDAHGVDAVDPGLCWLENNVYNSGSGTLTIPVSTAGSTTFIGSLGALTISDATSSYLWLAGPSVSAGGSLSLKTALRHIPVNSSTTTGTVTLNPVNGDYQRIAPTGNITVGSTTGTQSDGQDLTIEVTQPASGGPYTVAWSSQYVFNGSTTPAASTAANAVDVFAFRWNGTAARWVERYRRLGYFTALQASNNLSDVGSASTSLTNLGGATAAALTALQNQVNGLTSGSAAAAAGAFGYAGWTGDYITQPVMTAPSASTWLAGASYFIQVNVLPSVSVNGFISFVWHTASGMVNSYLSVYTVSGGVLTLVGSTADLSSTASGFQRIAVSGFTTTPASGILYVGYMNGTSGVAGGPYYQPSEWASSTPTAAKMPAAAGVRYVAFSGSYSSPPSPFTLSTGSIAATPPWLALD